jgi:hypothetical protein
MSTADGAQPLAELLEWFRQQDGCRLFPAAEVAHYEYQGRGLRVSAPITKGNPLISVPLPMLFSAKAAKADPALAAIIAACPTLRDDDLLALSLLHERSLGAASARAQHIASLPTDYDLTIFWTEEELAELVGSNVKSITEQLHAQTRADFASLQQVLEPLAAAGTFSLQVGYEDYCWALATIWSRSMDIPDAGTGEAGATIRVIAPVADLFNTDTSTPCCHGYDSSDGSLKVVAGADAGAGEQLLIGYGALTNSRALWLYGFVMADNPHDAVDLFATMSTEVPSYSKRRKLLEAIGLGAHCVNAAHVLSIAEPLPPELLLNLRVQHAPKQLLRAWRDDPAKFAEQGRRVCAARFVWCCVSLAVGTGLMLPGAWLCTAPRADDWVRARVSAARTGGGCRGRRTWRSSVPSWRHCAWA